MEERKSGIPQSLIKEQRKSNQKLKKVELIVQENLEKTGTIFDLVQQRIQKGNYYSLEEAKDIIIKTLILLLQMIIKKVQFTPSIVSIVADQKLEYFQPFVLYEPQESSNQSKEWRQAIRNYRKAKLIYDELVATQSFSIRLLEVYIITQIQDIVDNIKMDQVDNKKLSLIFNIDVNQENLLEQFIINLNELDQNEHVVQELKMMFEEFQIYMVTIYNKDQNRLNIRENQQAELQQIDLDLMRTGRREDRERNNQGQNE